ncbi:MAG: RnfABCDGE type electron transport complex subunit B, partial [Peptococcaceae bacterium]|nr:RnfABCDGE type electron transport complex subunit B [Peptococcaceae bacterium]
MDMNYIIVVLLLMGIIGLFFGCVLAFANKKLAVEMNPLIHLVEDILPKGQCGSCGYAGCQAYAEAVVLNEDVPPNLCIPGKQEVALKVAELTGKDSGDVEPQRAYVRCTSPLTAESEKYRYSGITNCVAASLMHSGPKNCQYGCLGMGSCVTQCVFDAIHMGAHGLPVIDKTFCTGCGKCATICPKKIIEVIPVSAHVVVACKSLDKGAVARKICT